MDDIADRAVFIEAARSQGFAEAPADAVLRHLVGQLPYPQRARYIFRTTQTPAPAIAPSATRSSGGRPRTVLAFPSPDAAIAFAQAARMTNRPRLVALSCARLLAALVQRPTIAQIIFTDEDEPPSRSLPTGVTIERTTLVALLQEGREHHGQPL